MGEKEWKCEKNSWSKFSVGNKEGNILTLNFISPYNREKARKNLSVLLFCGIKEVFKTFILRPRTSLKHRWHLERRLELTKKVYQNLVCSFLFALRLFLPTETENDIILFSILLLFLIFILSCKMWNEMIVKFFSFSLCSLKSLHFIHFWFLTFLYISSKMGTKWRKRFYFIEIQFVTLTLRSYQPG